MWHVVVGARGFNNELVVVVAVVVFGWVSMVARTMSSTTP